MLQVDEFTEELCAFIETIIATGDFDQISKFLDGFRNQLRYHIHTLLDKYEPPQHNRSSGPLFVIGDELNTATTIANKTSCTCVDAEVQVDMCLASSMANNISAITIEDDHLLTKIHAPDFKHRELEKYCHPLKAVQLRRLLLEKCHKINLESLPFQHYDYTEVKDACCENVIGYLPIPTGVAGPLFFDNNEPVLIPLSTTEGALVASVNRGIQCINESTTLLGSDALYVKVFKDGITRAPVLKFGRVQHLIECYEWIQRIEVFTLLKNTFEETSRYAILQRIEPILNGDELHLRFMASTGDAMGMNMITKGTGRVLELIKNKFPKARVISISGNECADKKASAINWIEGRGKSVVAECVVPKEVVERVLKTSVDKMVELGYAKLMVGSSSALTIGGWNAHAANMVAAMFIATGQDVAQVVSSSMCMTQLTKRSVDNALQITCTMNCLEVGTIGGGTVLTPQSTCLEMLGCRQPNLQPGKNAERFARLVCATVMAGELSLLASQCKEGDLEQSHLKLNRSSRNLCLSGSSSSLIYSNSVSSLNNNSDMYTKSRSMAKFPQPIPEHQPIGISNKPQTMRVPEQQKQPFVNIGSKNPHDNTAMKSRTHSKLSQTSSKLKHHMPCNPF